MKKFFLLIAVILIIGFLFFSAVFYITGVYLPIDPGSEKSAVFIIEKGDGSGEIAQKLEKEKLIWRWPFFRIYVYLEGSAKNLQAGKYLLSPSMNIPQIAEKFSKGDVIKEKITIIEGWNLRNIGFYFENKGMFQAEELWELAGFPAADYSEENLPLPKDFSKEYDFLKEKPENVGLEGYIFPDTYEIIEGSSLEEIIKKTLDNFNRKIDSAIKEEISKQGKTIFEIITMASLIEKEVKDYEDKELVSGIFWKRMEAGMPLQSCASISYILGIDKWVYSYEDTREQSPYNTYLKSGLPLGPICNPGMESIMAATYPKDSNYWYYLSTPEGKTIFSKTLQEHNEAIAKYLR